MPIYEYLCNSCGAKKEHIHKMNDAPIKICPECGSEDYTKLVSAAGFQLKGSGWYVTDFKNKPSQPTAKTEKNDELSKQKDSQSDAAKKTSESTTGSVKTVDSKPGSTATAAD
ncbi:zinc ribbon domain-containing protein [Nitrosomonas sp.]|uniref:FmdB family zinc ribbon protein n=1 Tax=Nitrosomonas sp. TaxID=42353 RepID=UPI002843652E|nr:zinc ribbon domain-containing protein [Nitrosomonas sp.]MDR4513284.1 zinc ribbon domain-containing protein [Nitrosomonas sp.]